MSSSCPLQAPRILASLRRSLEFEELEVETAELDIAMAAINSGEVYRFLLKPCDPDVLTHAIRQAVQLRELTLESARLLSSHRKKSAVLSELERDNPGVSDLERDAEGSTVIDDEATDIETLLAATRAESWRL